MAASLVLLGHIGWDLVEDVVGLGQGHRPATQGKVA